MWITSPLALLSLTATATVAQGFEASRQVLDTSWPVETTKRSAADAKLGTNKPSAIATSDASPRRAMVSILCHMSVPRKARHTSADANRDYFAAGDREGGRRAGGATVAGRPRARGRGARQRQDDLRARRRTRARS